ncbi:hypothetical protein QOT17_002827 [Balamuthia mandrillaris]
MQQQEEERKSQTHLLLVVEEGVTPQSRLESEEESDGGGQEERPCNKRKPPPHWRPGHFELASLVLQRVTADEAVPRSWHEVCENLLPAERSSGRKHNNGHGEQDQAQCSTEADCRGERSRGGRTRFHATTTDGEEEGHHESKDGGEEHEEQGGSVDSGEVVVLVLSPEIHGLRADIRTAIVGGGADHVSPEEKCSRSTAFPIS